MSSELFKTALNKIHHLAGAKMVPFAGYEMPVSYAGIKLEHIAVRQKVGLFDVSHMGNFEVLGPQSLLFLEALTSNGVHKLNIGDVQYSSLCRDDGMMIDDILVYRYEEERFQVIVNAGNKEVDWLEFSEFSASYDVELKNRSSELGILALQGPNAIKVVQQIWGEEMTDMAFYSCAKVEYEGFELLMSRTGYTGEDGFEFYPNDSQIVPMWNQFLKLGKDFELELCGLGCRDTLRLEAGYSLYGHELNLETHPLDSGLAWICDLETEFRGRDAMVLAKSEAGATTIIGLEMTEKGIPREGYEVFLGEEKIGVITSGSISPLSGKSIAMARVLKSKVKIGNDVSIMIREKSKAAQVVSRRFYQRG